jgi:hypothetical protein
MGVNYYAAASGTRRWLILAVLCVTLLLITVDDAIFNVDLASIVRGLGATSTQSQWIADAVAIFFAGLLLTFGAVGTGGPQVDTHGGAIVFGGGSALAAWSGTPDRLIGAMAIMELEQLP